MTPHATWVGAIRSSTFGVVSDSSKPGTERSGDGEGPQAMPLLDRMNSLDSMEGLLASEPAPNDRSARLGPYARLIVTVYPGVLAAATIGLAAAWLAEHYTAPVMLFALLLGMAFRFLHEQGRCVAGIEFASRTVLRFGVALLGARITADQIAGLGWQAAATIIIGVATTIAVGMLVSRMAKLSFHFGLLSGSSVAICGASAALAVASVLPRSKTLERDTVLTVVTVTAISTVAMILYPSIVTVSGLDAVHGGIFLGGTIHDVAQVVGAGYSLSTQTGDVATIVKMLRVAMLVPVVLAISLLVASGAGHPASRRVLALPSFLVAFVILVIANSLGLIPALVVGMMSETARWCLIVAIAALGMKTSFKDLATAGLRPFVLILAETLWIGALVFAAVHWII